MPTGYTAGVSDGTVTDFREFTLNCARAFGSAIMMRDDSSGPIDIDKCLDTSSIDRHIKELEKAKKRRARTDEEILVGFDEHVKSSMDGAQQGMDDNKESKARYEAMLVKVEAWVPPGEEHTGLKEFMVKQLTDSMEWDCSGDYHEKAVSKSKELTPEDYLKGVRDSDQWNFEYHQKGIREGIARNDKRREWITGLLDSLQEEEVAV